MVNNNSTRRRPKPPKHVIQDGPRVINAAHSLEQAEMYGVNDTRTMYSKVMAFLGYLFIETIPQWLAVGLMLSLIFGGCCSNVFALEAIIKVEPSSGKLQSARRPPPSLPYLANCLMHQQALS